MKSRIFNNIGLKAAALFLAFVVWLAVVNVNDPMVTVHITGVPVATVNTSYLESMGLSSRLAAGSGTVTVTVTGNRSVVEKLSKENVRAEADLTQILSMDAEQIMVPVTVTVTGASGATVSSSPRNVEISVEEMQDADFIVLPTSGETRLPVTTQMIGSLTSDPESITITGPGSLIAIIDRVTAPVDVSRMYVDGVIDTDLQIYDKNGSLFTESQMDSLKFSVTDGVSVSVDLWDIISDVSLKANVSGVPGTGYRVGDIYTTPSLFSVGGTDSALYELEQNGKMIDIPEEMLDVDGATEDQEFRIDLTEILPKGVRLADNTSATAIVDIEILPLDSRSFELLSVDIEQKNLEEGLGVIFQSSKFKVHVQGYGEKLASLTEDDIRAVIDLKGVSEGTKMSIPVQIILPDGLSVIDPVTVKIEVANISENTASPTPTGAARSVTPTPSGASPTATPAASGST